MKGQVWDGSEREKKREKYNCIIISKMLIFIYLYGHVYDADAYKIRKRQEEEREEFTIEQVTGEVSQNLSG